MSRFIQLHVLTSYPACNLNRDDSGRPKTLQMYGDERLRVSSQSLKRAWRCGDAFQEAFIGKLGTRTKEVPKYVYYALVNGATFEAVTADTTASGDLPTLAEAKAVAIARAIGGVFAKNKAEFKAKKESAEDDLLNGKSKKFWESLETEQLAHISPAELANVASLVEACRASGKEPAKEELALLRKTANAVDIALFGRMFASATDFNVEASVQVAHAFTVQNTVVSDDYFTAVDDLNKDDAGAAHIGVSEFGAGLFYSYVCIDRELLLENLGNDEALLAQSLRALVTSMCTISPTGKQNSFASRAMASFCMAEKGDMQPRTLAEAFMKKLDGYAENPLEVASVALMKKRAMFERILGEEPTMCHYDAEQGTLKDVCDFVATL